MMKARSLCLAALLVALVVGCSAAEAAKSRKLLTVTTGSDFNGNG